jgi:hypothetical protein
LELDYPSGQTARGTAEIGICNDRTLVKEANRLQIQLVENVEEIGTQLQIRLLTQEPR